MPYEELTGEAAGRLKKALTERIAENPDKNDQRNDRTSELWKTYSMGSPSGKQVYRSFTDEELLEYLRTLAARLDHAPSQREVFWVLREYIKCRFGKWPYALRAAGLSASAGSGGRTMGQQAADRKELASLLQQVRDKAAELGRIPHPGDMPDACRRFRRYYDRWGQVLEAARMQEALTEENLLKRSTLRRMDDLEPEYLEMLEVIRADAQRRGRSPAHGETEPALQRALIRRCGSWRNALYQIGLTPLIRRKPFNSAYIDYRKSGNRSRHAARVYDCFYEVLNLSDWDRSALAYIDWLYRSTGRIPLKEEVAKDLRKRLQADCGTWANALFQIGISPDDYYDAVRESRLSRKEMGGKTEK